MTTISVDAYIASLSHWQVEIQALRTLLTEAPLTETIKWRAPCYMANDRNVILLGAQRHCCVLSFVRGHEIVDTGGFLEFPGPNTHTSKVWRFESLESIHVHQEVIRQYIGQAIALSGTPSAPTRNSSTAIEYPAELLTVFSTDSELETAFRNLTPGRQRGYCLHFSSAKQSNTRHSRIQKARAKIIDGFGMHDCHCGKSRRMPRCDGSHSRG
jgi:uncharacterized protein YdeI (YjbR/CyaY-like superfamily)